jgi:DNA polymerase III epsilon subunit family exonuclease
VNILKQINSSQKLSLFSLNDDLLLGFINQFGCVVIEHLETKMKIQLFSNFDRYNDFLNGINCVQGSGVFSLESIVDPIKLEDNITLIIKKRDKDLVIHKFVPIVIGIIKYRDKESNKYRQISIRIRKDQYSGDINLILPSGETSNSKKSELAYFLFKNINQLNDYLHIRFGEFDLIETNEENEMVEYISFDEQSRHSDNFISIDFETTGKFVEFDEIIQIGAIKFENGIEVASFNELVQPNRKISQAAYNIHGISNKDLENSRSISEVFPEFINFISGGNVVIHNASFELSFIKKHLQTPMKIRYFCTRQFAERHKYIFSKSKLESIADHYGIIAAKYHDALSDARTAALIFEKYKFEFPNENFEFVDYECNPTKLPGKSIINNKKELSKLLGILQGILLDSLINDDELIHLQNWINENVEGLNSTLYENILNEILVADRIDEVVIRRMYNKLLNYQENMDNAEKLGFIKGVLQGGLADGKLSNYEILSLREWVRLNSNDLCLPIIRELKDKIDVILLDGILEESERKELIALINRHIHIELNGQNKTNINHEFENIIIENKRFCLTGNLSNFSDKNSFIKFIESYGGIYSDSVSKKTDFLILGELGDERYSNNGIGTKETKAREINSKNASQISIMSEVVFVKLCGNKYPKL